MAGIREAMKRVMDHRNEGRVVAKGMLKECSCDGINEGCSLCADRVPYIIIRLKEDQGLITVYHQGDILIDSSVEVGSDVILMIRNNWRAAWVNIDKVKNCCPEAVETVEG